MEMIYGEKIDRKRVKEVFREYTDAYDVSDEKIKLKIGHTYRVADLCERIAVSEGMNQADADLAWLLGMLHDVGRFEQLRQYHTFIDADSVDHAMLGADILFGKEEDRMNGRVDAKTGGRIRDYLSDDSTDQLIETAIRVHSAYRIPEQLEKRTARFCHMLRDADKIDILRVNIDTPLEEIYDTTTEKLRNEAVSDEVMKSFYEHHAIFRGIRKTVVDHVVGHISLVYELVYPKSIQIVKEQGYLEKLMDFKSENPKTREQFRELREEMERFLSA